MDISCMFTVKCWLYNQTKIQWKYIYNLYFDYLLIVKEEGVPQKIIADRGAENVNIASSQPLMRNHSDLLSGYHSL